MDGKAADLLPGVDDQDPSVGKPLDGVLIKGKAFFLQIAAGRGEGLC